MKSTNNTQQKAAIKRLFHINNKVYSASVSDVASSTESSKTTSGALSFFESLIDLIIAASKVLTPFFPALSPVWIVYSSPSAASASLSTTELSSLSSFINSAN